MDNDLRKVGFLPAPAAMFADGGPNPLHGIPNRWGNKPSRAAHFKRLAKKRANIRARSKK